MNPLCDTVVAATSTPADPKSREQVDDATEGIAPRLSALLDEVASFAGVDALRIAELRRKLEQRTFNVVVAGEFKRGKSSVINALIGAPVLPTGVVPLTSVVTLLSHADAPSVEVTFNSGETRREAIDALPEFVTERGNPDNAKGIREVSVGYPAPWLEQGIQLVDTPGIGSVHQHNTEVTHQFLPQADAVIIVASVEQPASRNELDFLVDIRQHAGKVFCLLNKIDQLSDADVLEAVAFAADALRAASGAPVPIFPISARVALQGRMTHDAALIARSRMPIFEVALHCFLLQERDAVFTSSVRRRLLRLLDEAHLSTELEVRALSEPLEFLDSKLQAFATKKTEVVQARADFEALLEADVRKLMKELVEPELNTFTATLQTSLEASLDAWYQELRPRGSGALQSCLEERTVDEVRRSFDVWLKKEEAGVSAAFDRLCTRFRQHVDDSVTELMRYCADLFAIPFEATGAESVWRGSLGFRYRFWSEPLGLQMARNALVAALPGAIGHPVILRDAKLRAADLVELHGGRLRHGFDELLKRNARDCRTDMLARAAATIDGLEAAIEKGRARRREGEDQTAVRRAELEATRNRLESLRGQVEGAG